MLVNQGSLKAIKSYPSGKLSLIGNSLHGEFKMRERWSAMTFSTPFLSRISRINFLKKEDPTNKSGLGILLHHEVPKRRMIGENCGFGP